MGQAQAVVLELREAVSGFMFMFDTRHFCFDTDALAPSQEGELNDGPNPVGDDNLSDRSHQTCGRRLRYWSSVVPVPTAATQLYGPAQ
jgi:hypothetical protein